MGSACQRTSDTDGYDPIIANNNRQQTGLSEEMKRWPDLVGLDGEEAKRRIEAESAVFKVHIVPSDAFITFDLRTDRVRIFVDKFNKVAKVPSVG